MIIIILLLICLQIALINSKVSSCGCGIERTSNENFISVINQIIKEPQECPVYNLKDVDLSKEFNIKEKMIYVPSGSYQFGTDDIIIEGDKEGPLRIVNLKAFYLDKYEVSNEDFTIFTAQTDYKTEAEIFGDSFVFASFINSTFKEKMKDYRVAQAPWWYKVYQADWKHPFGPDSNISGLMNHPVTHISWNDARAYCMWRGARLPTEAEWEAACRGGRHNIKYPWGDKLFPERKHMANIWQGTFPNYNSEKDGFLGTNPVDLYPQNDWNFHNLAGNVWEWTDDSWLPENPKEKVKKGGSYLCHRSYCYRYRCSARSHNTEDSSAGNLGFRCAKSA